MKIIALPSGKQPGIRGAVVIVPVTADKECESPSPAGLVSLKLKRKLTYKNHVWYQNIRPHCIKTALSKLKQILYWDNQRTNPGRSTVNLSPGDSWLSHPHAGMQQGKTKLE